MVFLKKFNNNILKHNIIRYFDNDGDTSGIGSMTTHFSDSSTASSKQKAALFKKAREKFNLSNSQNQQASTNIQESNNWNKLTNSNPFQHITPILEMSTTNTKRFGVADFSSLPFVLKVL